MDYEPTFRAVLPTGNVPVVLDEQGRNPEPLVNIIARVLDEISSGIEDILPYLQKL